MRQEDINLVNEPIPNMDLLDEVIDRIEGDIDGWDQGSWGDVVDDGDAEYCGTTACFAGHAVQAAGLMRLKTTQKDFDGEPYWAVEWIDMNTGKRTTPEHVPEKARKALGLTYEEADDIFFHFTSDKTEAKRAELQWFKTKVEEIRYRAKQQAEAFDRIAEELLSDPDLVEYEALLKKGWCPESRDALIGILRRFGND